MPSSAQLNANQQNAKKSTGPRTDTGKSASSQNARTHGLAASQLVILSGQQEEFDAFSGDLRDDLRPAGALEDELFLQLLHAAWTLRRCRLAETELSIGTEKDPLLDDTNEAKLRRIDLYSRRAQSTFNRTIKELRAVQTERQYRFEVQPPDDYPEEAECMRGAAPLIDFTRIKRELRAKNKPDDSPDDLFRMFAPPADLLRRPERTKPIRD